MKSRTRPAGSTNGKLETHLFECAREARAALHRAAVWRSRLELILEDHSVRVERVALPRVGATNVPLRQLQEQFSQKLEELKGELEAIGVRLKTGLGASFRALEENAGFVTIALFGRTKAGKSTTMEALTHGDGSSRGHGAQHKTKAVKEYYWPPGQQTLRVVDTPGIEGFQGEALGEMAETYIGRADLIFFLISDDKASPEELDRFAGIRTIGKSVVVILNVKEKDVDWLVEHPEAVFVSESIDGHRRRICRYLAEHFDLDAPEILPVHALAAWESTQTRDPSVADRLRERSRIDSIEERLQAFALREALAARIRSPRDCIYSYGESAKDQLRPYAGAFRMLHDAAVRQQASLVESAATIIAAERRRCSDLSTPFEEAQAEVAELVDTLVASRKGGAALNRAWDGFLQKHGLDHVERTFKMTVVARLQAEIASQVADAGFDADQGRVESDIASLFGAALSHAKNEKAKMWARAGIQAGATAGAGALAGWAMANFWNPTGWAALAAAGVLSVAAGLAGGWGGKAAADAWKESDRKALARERDEIVAALKRSLQLCSGEIESRCLHWLDDLPTALRRQFEDGFGFVEDASRTVWRATVRTLHELDSAAAELDYGWLQHCFGIAQLGGVQDARLLNAACAGKSGVKFLVASSAGTDLADARWAPRLHELVGTRVALIDANAPLESQVAAALAPAKVSPESVHAQRAPQTFRSRRGQMNRGPRRDPPSVHVRMDADEAKAAIGSGGENVRAAQRLLGLKIRIVGPRDQGESA